jgi:phage terminase large subunit-like protein
VPEEDVEARVRKDRVPYDVWLRAKHLESTPGNTTDFAFIFARIVQLAAVYDIREIAFDRMFMEGVTDPLQKEGMTVIAFGQGFLSMAPPTAEFLRMLKAGELQHGGHPVRWGGRCSGRAGRACTRLPGVSCCRG